MSDGKDYVMLPLDADEGEIQVGEVKIPVSLADIDKGIVVVGTPKGTSTEERAQIASAIGKAQEERDPEERRTFIIVDGEIGSAWKFWRIVPRKNYDSTFDEEVSP